MPCGDDPEGDLTQYDAKSECDQQRVKQGIPEIVEQIACVGGKTQAQHPKESIVALLPEQ